MTEPAQGMVGADTPPPPALGQPARLPPSLYIEDIEMLAISSIERLRIMAWEQVADPVSTPAAALKRGDAAA